MSVTVFDPAGDAAIPEAELEAAMPAPSLRRIALASTLCLVVGLGGLLGWAAATPIESAVVTTGMLVAEGRRKTIQLLEPGLLRELLVREGEAVAAGQPLLRLDVTQADAQANQARTQRWAPRRWAPPPPANPWSRPWCRMSDACSRPAGWRWTACWPCRTPRRRRCRNRSPPPRPSAPPSPPACARRGRNWRA
jgi:hypothetical protein